MAIIGEGGVDNRLWCQFWHTDLDPTNIRLPLGAAGVSWEYSLNTSVQDTYGGQVIQILGVTVTNLVIRGNFGGIDPQWGAEQKRDGSFSVLETNQNPNPRFGDYEWIHDAAHPWVNGIQQMADWFRRYFELTTQGAENRKGSFERYNQTSMKFQYPARGWSFLIRPRSFPKVTMANDALAPEWTVEADFVEEAETDRSFVKDVEKTALDRLEDLKVGIGFQRRNPFSEFINKNITNEEAAFNIINEYQDSVTQGLSDDEIDELIEFGFSYPGSAYKRADFDPSSFGF
jgi:hypothetical protein